jgi:hypothetical protein
MSAFEGEADIARQRVACLFLIYISLFAETKSLFHSAGNAAVSL